MNYRELTACTNLRESKDSVSVGAEVTETTRIIENMSFRNISTICRHSLHQSTHFTKQIQHEELFSMPYDIFCRILLSVVKYLEIIVEYQENYVYLHIVFICSESKVLNDSAPKEYSINN